MEKKLNDGLKSRQEMIKNKTVKAVEEAIVDLMEEGAVVSTKLLMERTGFSRPVFGKTHVLEVLKKYGVCRYRNIKNISKESDKNYVVDLERQIKELIRELDKSRKTLDSAIKRNIKLEVEIKDLKDTNELLRGQLLLNYEKALEHGLDFEKDNF